MDYWWRNFFNLGIIQRYSHTPDTCCLRHRSNNLEYFLDNYYLNKTFRLDQVQSLVYMIRSTLFSNQNKSNSHRCKRTTVLIQYLRLFQLVYIEFPIYYLYIHTNKFDILFLMKNIYSNFRFYLLLNSNFSGHLLKWRIYPCKVNNYCLLPINNSQ